MPLAHVRQETNGSWTIHHLEQHLLATAALAQQFAAQFQSGEWGELAGRWHDLGKYRPAFQRHICTSSGYDPNYRIPAQANRNTRHASTGAVQAQVAMERLKAAPHGRILAYLIAGHHAGLPDCDAAEQARGQPLNDVLQDGELLAEALQQAIPAAILSASYQQQNHSPDSPQDCHLWIRMLFSALVDADRLDTEAFGSPDKAQLRSAADHPDMATLLSSFNAHMQELQRQAQPDSTMNQARSAVLARARSQAQQAPGIYTMTVPTGGGKTLSSLAFALEHAVAHGKRRIIYAIPYSSIIDQTAKTFRAVFEQHPEVVLEHHSSAELAASREGESSESKKYAESLQLATENWDVPIIVTTTVQLFESLFAAKPSRCRKLHNLVNSVIVLDETQLLPPNNLQPIRHVIELLQKHYGVSFLLTTATPVPAAGVRDALSLEALARPAQPGNNPAPGAQLPKPPARQLPTAHRLAPATKLGADRSTNTSARSSTRHRQQAPGRARFILRPRRQPHRALPPLGAHVPQAPPARHRYHQAAPARRPTHSRHQHPISRSWGRP